MDGSEIVVSLLALGIVVTLVWAEVSARRQSTTTGSEESPNEKERS